MDWRITYDSGNKKWTNDRPGDGKGDPEERDDLFDDLTVKRAVKRLQKAIGDYAAGEKGAETVQKAVEDFELHAGVEAARTGVRAIHEAVKGKGKIEEGAEVAKDHVNRERKDMNREARIAERVAARTMKADYGDVPAYFNVFDFFNNADGGRQLPRESVGTAEMLLQSAVLGNLSAMRKLVVRTLKRHEREIEEAGLSLK